jgi:AraC family transcriptional regulator, glycine betaine-responsive activator
MESEVKSATNELPLPSLAHFGFLTLPGFSMIAFTSAVEVLRMANYVDRAQHYRWSILTPDGVPVRASNGITLKPACTLEQAGKPDVLIVCGGTQIRSAVDSSVRELLGDVAQQSVPLGGMCTGAYALMSVGLLDDYRCTVDWEDPSVLRKEFPRVHFADELFVIDRDRLTCVGGTAPLDLMLELVSGRLGENVALQVSLELNSFRPTRRTQS